MMKVAQAAGLLVALLAAGSCASVQAKTLDQVKALGRMLVDLGDTKEEVFAAADELFLNCLAAYNADSGIDCLVGAVAVEGAGNSAVLDSANLERGFLSAIEILIETNTSEPINCTGIYGGTTWLSVSAKCLPQADYEGFSSFLRGMAESFAGQESSCAFLKTQLNELSLDNNWPEEIEEASDGAVGTRRRLMRRLQDSETETCAESSEEVPDEYLELYLGYYDAYFSTVDNNLDVITSTCEAREPGITDASAYVRAPNAAAPLSRALFTTSTILAVLTRGFLGL